MTQKKKVFVLLILEPQAKGKDLPLLRLHFWKTFHNHQGLTFQWLKYRWDRLH